MSDHLPAVVINLDRHPERLAFFMAQAARAGLRAERIAAVDARAPQAQPLIRTARAAGSPLSDSEIACLISHRKAWQLLLQSAHPWLAIFEDDAHLAEGMANWLKPQQLPAGTDLIKLEAYAEKVVLARRSAGRLGHRQLRPLLSQSYGSAGYVISRRCAGWLLDATADYPAPVDHVLFGERPLLPAHTVALQLVPAACVQDAFLPAAGGVAQRFASALEHTRRRPDGPRALFGRRKSRGWRNLRRYVAYVWRGAHPWHLRTRVALDLGRPSEAAP